ncbi:hypothetical protein ABIB58_001491 [Brevundimonas sp. UYEF29]|uniref:hypothetical protein n=1 Tax=Brevundimonas sp. UYEF29 TaxID=3156346 RepID=UPI00339ABA75
MSEDLEHLLVPRRGARRPGEGGSDRGDQRPLGLGGETGFGDPDVEIARGRAVPRPVAERADVAVGAQIDLVCRDPDPVASVAKARLRDRFKDTRHDVLKDGVGLPVGEDEASLDLNAQGRALAPVLALDDDVVERLAQGATLDTNLLDRSGSSSTRGVLPEKGSEIVGDDGVFEGEAGAAGEFRTGRHGGRDSDEGSTS